MSNVSCTLHARTRMQQRGIRVEDIPLALACATPIDEATWLVRGCEVDREIECRKREIQLLEHLKNHELVLRDGRLVTIYPSRREHLRRKLRRGRHRGLRDFRRWN